MRTLTFQELGRYGRLGNQMFQIASTIGIARKNKWKFAFPYWQNHDHIERFGSKEDLDVQKHFINPLPVYTGNRLPDTFVHWGYWPITLRGERDISLSGHMQSEMYFNHCSDEIRYYFTMKDEYPKNDYCAIHVRLGDYDDNYHPRLKMDYYTKAMSMFPYGTKFLVFSDEPWMAAEMFVDVKYLEVIVQQDTMTDFKLMKSCKHFIIGNSTYSWWAAWLSNQPGKKVIAPANWFGKIANLSSKDIYFNGTTVI